MTITPPADLRCSPDVAAALDAGRPVVALESTILAHGLPAPANRAAATELEEVVRAHGAVPATVAVLDGTPRVGLTAAELDRVCDTPMAKLSARDLGVAAGPGPRRRHHGGRDGDAGRAGRHRRLRDRRAGRGAPRRRARPGTCRPISVRSPSHRCWWCVRG